jgi:hypothetical protein
MAVMASTDTPPAGAPGRPGAAGPGDGGTRPPSTAPLLAAAVLVAVACGSFAIVNTSIGWHLASGRLILDTGRIPRVDPFSFTAAGTPWIDHEWLFQVLVATLDRLGGAPALIGLRIAVAVALTLLLLAVGRRHGLSPPAALVLAALCVYGTRGRLFVRPELVTLLVVPAVIWIVLARRRRPTWRSVGSVAALVVVGVNCHAAVLVVPVILAALVGADVVAWLARRERWPTVLGGAAHAATAAAVPLLNPAGWHLYQVPVRLTRLVGQPHVPNPEWISPTPVDQPLLWAAAALAMLVLAAREREPARWVLLAVAAALALRHVRNVGLFFVLLPLATAPALARLPAFADVPDDARRSRRTRLAAVLLTTVLAVAAFTAPWPPPGFGLAGDRYPIAACDAMDRLGLPVGRLYNDVNFGGYLIGRYFPPRRVFIDDRNEIHEELLATIWRIFTTSDRRGWEGLLERWRIDTALVRYHPPWWVYSPGGEAAAWRGFSAVWFPREAWALVYFDDVAMVLVRRAVAPPEILALEYRLLRPDDLAEVERVLASRPELRSLAAEEIARAAAAAPGSVRVRALADLLLPPTPSTRP